MLRYLFQWQKSIRFFIFSFLCKALIIIILVLNFYTLNNPIFAESSTTFYLKPDNGVIFLNKEFFIDIMLNTNSKSISFARSVIIFNPELIKVNKVEHNDLFCQYLEDGSNYIIDNTQGKIVITAFAKGDNNCPYVTNSSAVFARVYFNPLKVGKTSIAFLYNGKDDTNYSSLIDNKSPPQFILEQPINSKEFNIIKKNDNKPLPPTGKINWLYFIIPIGFILASFIILRYNKK